MFTRSKLMISLTVLLLAASVVFATIVTVTAPNSSATVGVPYSSTIGASGGNLPYSFILTGGSLPTGLSLNSVTGAIIGTPTTAGPFPFTVQVTDTTPTGANTDTMTASRRHASSANGTPLGSTSSSFTITVAASPSPTPVPPSVWMAMMGLAGAGLFRVRQMRRV